MAINYAEIFNPALDALAVAESTTGWMDANAGQVIYDGGKTIKVPNLTMDGLGNYSRTDGYGKGKISLTWEPHTMSQDRGTQFLLDSLDVNETNFAAQAANVTNEFTRTKVVPEVDAYRISKLATLAIDAAKPGHVENGYTPAADTIVDKLKDSITVARESGFSGPFVIHASYTTLNAFEKAVGKFVSKDTFETTGYSTICPMLDGYPIIGTPSDRMVSAIKVKPLDEGGGYEKGVGAKDINFIVVPMTAPIGVNKQDAFKVFAPEVVQDADGWLIDYRRYHDLFVLENKVAGIVVNTK